MACPMGYGVQFEGGYSVRDGDDECEGDNDASSAQDGLNKAAFSDHISYSQYLGLDKLLSCQQLRSGKADQLVPDEHLFIIIHQAYELWFKQIIFDIDHVRKLLDNKIVDETKTLKIVSLLERTVRILKLLVDQMLVLETMSPLDFVEFRKYLASASGFQSLQFRLLENKLGVAAQHRVRYNAQHYREAFANDEDRQRVLSSEVEPSLFALIEKWLARTPGIYEEDIVAENEISAPPLSSPRNDDDSTSSASPTTAHDFEPNAPLLVLKTVTNNGSLCWKSSLYDGLTPPSKTSVGRSTPDEDDRRIQHSLINQPLTLSDGGERCKCAERCDNAANAVGAGSASANSNNNDAANGVAQKERNASGATDDENSQTAIKRKNFWNRYLEAVDKYLQDMKTMAKNKNLPPHERKNIQDEYVKTMRSFETITNEKQHQAFIDKGERRLSHNALKGALMIYFYRDMPRFSQPYQILTFLMDIDSLLQKWRYNHVMLVQRMLGSKAGTGGSSGYHYLRSTVSDRYKVFLDLYNLSTWLIPRVYIPKLSPRMVKTLSEHSNLNN